MILATSLSWFQPGYDSHNETKQFFFNRNLFAITEAERFEMGHEHLSRNILLYHDVKESGEKETQETKQT